MKITQMEFGWLIGILEGEGSFGYYGTQRISMEMTDEDTMRRYADLMGKILSKRFELTAVERCHRVNRDNHSIMFKLIISSSDARFIMKFIVHHMGSRRRVRIWQALNKYSPKKKSLSEIGIDLSSLTSYATERMTA